MTDNNKIKTIMLLGTAQKNSFLYKVSEQLLDFLYSVSCVRKYDSYFINPHPCIDCRTCENEFKCVYNDLDDIYSDLIDSNFLIIISPIFNASLPSPLKCVLDRLQPFYYSKKRGSSSINKAQKSALIITSQGSKDADYNDIIEREWRPNLKIIGFEDIEFLSIKGLDNDNTLNIDNCCIKCKNKLQSIINKLIPNI